MVITLGIDEVGRGAWAGPLVAGAVVLGQPIAGLKDSKQLSKKQRANLNEIIINKAAAFGVGWVSPAEIDKYGITISVRLAMERALSLINITVSEIIIDGHLNFLPFDSRSKAIIKADVLFPVVSAASIIAKVARDKWMSNEASSTFPVYGFEKHVGYGTELHRNMLKAYGVCSLHRKTFKPIRSLLV